MKKIETLQDLQEEVSRLEGINTDLLANIPGISSIWYEITNVPLKVIYEAKELFGSDPYYSNGSVKVQYTNNRQLTLFAISVPAVRTAPQVSDFAEAS